MSALQFNAGGLPDYVKPLSIIVLDDDRFDRKRISRWASMPVNGPVNLFEAADLHQFSKLLSAHDPDLILMDYELADGDGVDAMDIYTKSMGNPSAYAVMVSGCDDPERVQRAMGCGCDRYIEKSELSGQSLVQFMAELRGGHDALPNGPHPQIAATDYWSARARRRSQQDEQTQVLLGKFQTKSENRTDGRLFPHEQKVWHSDWDGARDFFDEFLSHDDIEFIRR